MTEAMCVAPLGVRQMHACNLEGGGGYHYAHCLSL